MQMSRPLVALSAAFLLAGCATEISGSASPAAGPPAFPSSPAETETEAPTAAPSPSQSGPERSQRGNIVKDIGEEGGLVDRDNDDQVVVRFSVDAITPDVACTAPYAVAPANGYFIAVDLRVATDPALPTDWYYSISPFDFSFVGPDGVTVPEVATVESYSCQADNELWSTSPLSPGSQYEGRIVLDLPATTGTLVYTASTVVGTEGWEWSF